MCQLALQKPDFARQPPLGEHITDQEYFDDGPPST
jgi:hypothetical protein